MILLTIQEEQHLDDGDLIRLLDGEGGVEEERVLRRHLSACSECKNGQNTLARLSERFSTALFGLEDATPSHPIPSPGSSRTRGKLTSPGTWGSHRSLRLAAISVLILGAVIAVTPARAWVVVGFEALKSLISNAPPVGEPAQDPRSVVSFVPVGEEFSIEFEETQSGGTLSIVLDTASSAAARIIVSHVNDELVVLRAGLRIRNTATSSASYEVWLPASCERLLVRIGGRVVARHNLKQSTRTHWKIDLATVYR